MDTSEINIIIEAIENEDIESLIKYSNRNISANEYQKMDNESKKELINNIYENILSKITNIDKNNVQLYLYLLLETGGSFTDFAMEYLTPEKVRGLELDKYTVTGIIGAIENEQIRNRFLFEGQDINDDNFECNIANVIKATGKIDEYLIPERVKELGLGRYDIIKLIKATGEIEKYLTPERVKELELDRNDIAELIKAIENEQIRNRFLFEGQDINDDYFWCNIANVIKATGEIQKYLTPERVKELGLDIYDITKLIKAIEDEEIRNKYLFEGQDINDVYLICSIANILKASDKYCKRIEKIFEKNKNIINTLIFDFIIEDEMVEILSEEQLIRITNYPYVQRYIANNYSNKCLLEGIKYLMKNDLNYIISLDRIIENEDRYKDLIDNLKEVDINNVEKKEEFLQKLLCILSDTENYFDIQNYDDVINYYYKKDEFCLKILKEEDKDKIYIPEKLNGYNEDDLLRFALLEYKFGISLENAKRIIKRYGTDSEKLPNNVISYYIRLLKEIIESEDINKIIRYANENDLLEEPWTGFPNAKDSEGKILNMFEELYNETLYKVAENQDDKYGKETYIETVIDEYGIQREIKHEIELYNIKKDFCMNLRVEGAYSFFKEPSDFKKYYNNLDITNHGNCESYIRNDSISIARNSSGVIVGYDNIQTNSLTSLGSYDLDTINTDFSIYKEENEFRKSNFRIPDEMINNTRNLHNELVKERMIIDKEGNVVKLQPNYAVWIEEETIEERMKTEWKEKREKDPQWIMTKKLAAQLGIPIVVIDREYFAKRETDKLEMMIKILKGEEIEKYENYKNDNGNLSEIEYEKCKKEYKKLSKAELIKEIIIKFENNRTGLQFNEKLNTKYFTQNKLNLLSDEMINLINELDKKEKLDCLQAYKDVVTNEFENLRYEYNTEINIVRREFYGNQVKNINDIESESEVEKDEREEKTEGRQKENKSYVLGMFSELYRSNGTDNEHVKSATEKLSKDLKSNGKENSKNSSHDIKGE